MKLRLLALLLLPASLFAATLRVNNTPGTSPDFTTIQEAVNHAENGDTILIEGSTTAYEGFQLYNKRLNLIGPGYALASNLGTPANKLSAVIGMPARIESWHGDPHSANGSLIMGLEFRAELLLQQCSNVTIARCLFTEHGRLRLAGPSNVVSQSFFQGSGAWPIHLAETASGTRIENCLMHQVEIMVGSSAGHFPPSFVCYLRNNLIYNIEGTSASLVVENNILVALYSASPGSVFNHNIFVHSLPPGLTGSGNIPDVDPHGIMARFFFGRVDRDADFVLAPLTDANPAFNAGTDGTHIGPFGGANPYVLSGVPPLPTIDELSVPTFAAPGADLTIRIKVSNRP